MNRKQIGRIGLSSAINYFTVLNYTVSLPINDTQWYDLIIEKDEIFQTVLCKATNTDDDSIDLRSTGGTKGKAYDNALNHKNLDLIFCVNKDLHIWIFPVSDLINANVTSSLKLRTEENKNH